MLKLHGDVYSCGYADRTASTSPYARDGGKYFKHKIKPFKIGLIVKNKEIIDNKMRDIFKKYSYPHENKAVFKEKKVKK